MTREDREGPSEPGVAFTVSEAAAGRSAGEQGRRRSRRRGARPPWQGRRRSPESHEDDAHRRSGKDQIDAVAVSRVVERLQQEEAKRVFVAAFLGGEPGVLVAGERKEKNLGIK